MNYIKNPVISGFNPDPSIVRVEDDYYIATSTFEWFPGIQIHHSKDLVNWRLIGHGLKETSQLDLKGVENSGGIYAPSLTYCDGEFWLAYSVVYACRGGTWMATPAYVVKSSSIDGPWSQAYSIGSFGFDPSIFHDDDQKKYVVHMIWDGRKGVNNFGGVMIQELDPTNMQLVGTAKKVFTGTPLKGTEGPQILKKDGWYYLTVAEGGTGFAHAITVARSKSILGPYEVHPENPILTTYLQEESELQRAGHGFFVETQTGEWYLSHLATRPVHPPEYQEQYVGGTFGKGFSVLGRESNIQKVKWENEWPYLMGGKTPQVEVKAPDLPLHPWSEVPSRLEFDQAFLPVDFQTLREPMNESWVSLTEREGYLRLRGRHYLTSNFEQSLIARRVQHFKAQIETAVEFHPTIPHQMAGMVIYYSNRSHYFLKLTADDEGKRYLSIAYVVDGVYGEIDQRAYVDSSNVFLRANFDKVYYQFSFSEDGNKWHEIGPNLSAVPISDEGSDDIFRFTGPMAAMFASDVSGQKLAADFSYFEYFGQ